MSETTDPGPRRFEFVPTPAVLSARARGSFIPCPVCETDNERYLFHKMGVRFVRCRSCGLVYANPPATAGREYFDVDAAGQHKRATDRALFDDDVDDIVRPKVAALAEERGEGIGELCFDVARVQDATLE